MNFINKIISYFRKKKDVWNCCPLCGKEMSQSYKTIGCVNSGLLHYEIRLQNNKIVNESFIFQVNDKSYFFERYNDGFYIFDISPVFVREDDDAIFKGNNSDWPYSRFDTDSKRRKILMLL